MQENLKDQLSEITELFKDFMPKNVAADDTKHMAMYTAYHKLKDVISGLYEYPAKPTDTVDQMIEKLAINANRKGWGQLFLRDDNMNPYGKFIGERPYPVKFWKQIDFWVAGFKEGVKTELIDK